MTGSLKLLMEVGKQEMDLGPDVATGGNCGYLNQEGQQLETEEFQKRRQGR